MIPVMPGNDQDRGDAIPYELLEQLYALRPVLERQGIVQFRLESNRTPSFRVRFRSADPETNRRTHRSIPIGDDPRVAEAVTALLQRWRQEWRWAVEVRRREAAAERVRVRDRRRLMRRFLEKCKAYGAGAETLTLTAVALEAALTECAYPSSVCQGAPGLPS